MTESDLTFVRTDIGLALLGGVIAALGAALAVQTELGWIVFTGGFCFSAVAMVHLAFRLAFPAGWRSEATGPVLMVAIPAAILGPFVIALYVLS